MVFSSLEFLFLFLPIFFASYFLVGKNFKNLIFVLFSIFFYAWGEFSYSLIMIFSIIFNYSYSFIISKYQSKLVLLLGVFINLSILVYFKYFELLFSGFFNLFDINFNKAIHLPIGISFFTFQAVSYLIDIYRKEVKLQKNFINLALYISMFPQLIAGPIVRYKDIEKSLNSRSISIDKFNDGLFRFIIGLSKKVLIANQLGAFSDIVFGSDLNSLGFSEAWLGIICFHLQIYFDFSGYSDMAIGLGKCLGYDYPENFNYPYKSKSIKEFWRRWHISLSSWFRDYLYIPLGGNRLSTFRTYLNLFIVFILCGLWHGASWNFLIWGLIHGFFLCFERVFNFSLKSKLISFLYLNLIVIFSWVFFSLVTFSDSILYISKMFSIKSFYGDIPLIVPYLNLSFLLFIFFSYLISFGTVNRVFDLIKSRTFVKYAYSLILFILSICSIASSAYNPFIYFRF